MATSDLLLSTNFTAGYPGRPGVLEDFEIRLEPGEILGLVGESGSGKSTAALAIPGLLRFQGGTLRGRIDFRGRNLAELKESEMRRIRGREIALVLQSPLSALNPSMRIGAQLHEAWRAHPGNEPDWPALLDQVNLPTERAFLERYPRQLSVGQAQRVLIAMAIVHRPALLIADEATSALDAVTQSEILKLFTRLNRELGMAILYISHDLLSVAALCHRIAILREGRIVETNGPAAIFREAQHPYTRLLLAAIPKLPVTSCQGAGQDVHPEAVPSRQDPVNKAARLGVPVHTSVA